MRHLATEQKINRCTPESCECMREGVEMVTAIRCMNHRNIPPMNHTEARGGECAACWNCDIVADMGSRAARLEAILKEVYPYMKVRVAGEAGEALLTRIASVVNHPDKV